MTLNLQPGVFETSPKAGFDYPPFPGSPRRFKPLAVEGFPLIGSTRRLKMIVVVSWTFQCELDLHSTGEYPLTVCAEVARMAGTMTEGPDAFLEACTKILKELRDHIVRRQGMWRLAPLSFI